MHRVTDDGEDVCRQCVGVCRQCVGVHTFVCKLSFISSGPATDSVSVLCQCAAEPNRQSESSRKRAERDKQSETGRAKQAEPYRQSQTGTATARARQPVRDR